MYTFLATLPAVLGITGFIGFHLIRKDKQGDEITRWSAADLRRLQLKGKRTNKTYNNISLA